MLKIVPLCFVVLFFFQVNCSKVDDLGIIVPRIQSQILDTIATRIATVTRDDLAWTKSIRDDGSWPDINYKDQGRAIWAASEHLTRLMNLVLLWAYPGQSYYHSSVLLEPALKALNYWLVHDYQNPNWWWNEIGVPQDIGQTLILLEQSRLLKNQSDKAVQIMARANWNGWTGANAVWMANIHVLSGSFQNNATYVKDAYEKMFSTLVIMPGIAEGIKVDGSFYQHGQQLYNGGYGADFVSDILGSIVATSNTSFEASADQLDAFEVLVLSGTQYMLNYGKSDTIFDYSVKGREITRPNALRCSFNAGLLGQVSGSRASEFKSLGQRLSTGNPPLIKSQHFWKSDYYMHRTSHAQTSVRMYSTRTYNSECVNEEGKLSLHLADGATNLYVTGHEFDNIFPAWDWRKIPGITCEQNGQALDCNHVKTLGKTTFVGGVSDGAYGVAAFDFKAPFTGTLTAHKSWYFFPNFVVALGADINCASSNEVVTSVNQCLLNGAVYASTSTNPLPDGTHQFSSSNLWLHHSQVGYYFPTINGEAQSLTLKNGPQSGSWQSIGESTGNVTTNVYSLWINHKQSAVDVTKGARYSYVAAPGLTLDEFKAILKDIQAVSSIVSTNYQAVQVNATGNEVTGVTFWEAGTAYVGGLVISTSKAGLLLVVKSSAGIEVSFADPTQLLVGTVDLVLTGLYTGNGCTNDGKSTKISLQLPTGEMKGSSVHTSCR